MPSTLPSLWVLAGIGLAGGFFSALFGVGGGIVIVPLLILLAGFEPRPAAATSLAIIGFTSIFGVATFSALDAVEWREAAIVGLPAMVGTVVGTSIQQHVPSRLLKLLFALFLVAVALRLFLA